MYCGARRPKRPSVFTEMLAYGCHYLLIRQLVRGFNACRSKVRVAFEKTALKLALRLARPEYIQAVLVRQGGYNPVVVVVQFAGQGPQTAVVSGHLLCLVA